VLQSLQELGVRMGVISNTGEETVVTMRAALEGAGIYDFFDPTLLIYSSVVKMTKDNPEIFREAAAAADLASDPQRCIFVGENPEERKVARTAHCRTAASPAAVLAQVSASLEPTGAGWRHAASRTLRRLRWISPQEAEGAGPVLGRHALFAATVMPPPIRR